MDHGLDARQPPTRGRTEPDMVPMMVLNFQLMLTLRKAPVWNTQDTIAMTCCAACPTHSLDI
jgi:hypothetical protein